MRVLIATVTAGAGHVQAACALEEAWDELRPRDTIERLDVLDFTPKLYRRVYIDSYLKLVERAPDLWAHMFKKTDDPEYLRKVKRMRSALSQLTTAKFVARVKRFKSEVVFCAHYMPSEIVGALKEELGGPLIANAVTDFEAHALWMQPGVDVYFVAASETKARLVARGLPAESVIVTGIPISARFTAPMDTPAIRKRLGVRDDLPVLLVLGGGFGMGPVARILEELNKVPIAMQVLVVCGRNEELRRELAAMDSRHPTRVFGFVDNMQELMAVSHLVITKPGGLTTSEALALGKPIFILDPIPGQEAANSDFLLENGAAAKANRAEDLPFRIEKIFASQKLDELAANARRLGRPNAARDICREVLRRASVVARSNV
jgi:processive 1,2-diacylglycerol beta-glucosyltransferase